MYEEAKGFDNILCSDRLDQTDDKLNSDNVENNIFKDQSFTDGYLVLGNKKNKPISGFKKKSKRYLEDQEMGSMGDDPEKSTRFKPSSFKASKMYKEDYKNEDTMPDDHVLATNNILRIEKTRPELSSEEEVVNPKNHVKQRSRYLFKTHKDQTLIDYASRKMNSKTQTFRHKTNHQQKPTSKLKSCYRKLRCKKFIQGNDIIFSSGSDDSDGEDMEGFTEKQRIEHIESLWKYQINLLLTAHKTITVYKKSNLTTAFEGDFTNLTKPQEELIFGVTEDIEYKEREEYTAKPRFFILLPTQRFYIIWNMIIIGLLCYIATFLPYRIAFIEDSNAIGWTIWDYFSDFLFFLDVVFSCITAYERKDGILEVRTRQIILNYAKGWLTIDVIACIPFTLIGILVGWNLGGSTGKLLRLARLPRLYKMIRILKVFNFIQVIQTNSKIKAFLDFLKRYSGILRLMKTVVYSFLVIHLISCLWYGIAKAQGSNPDTWLARGGYQDKSEFYLYLLCVYWALQTLTTVGFGDITAKTEVELYVTIFWMIFGVIFYSITVSNLASIISSLDVAESRTQAYLSNLNEFSIDLPDGTHTKIRQFIEVNSKNSDNSEYQDLLLNDLPSSLRSEVIAHTHGEVIRKILFFRDKDISFMWKIVPMLKPLKAMAGLVIYNQQEKGKEMYFILKGRIKLWYNLSTRYLSPPSMKGFNQYVEGSYFGDCDIFTGIHDSTAMPATEVNLLVLSRVDVKRLIEKIPKDMERFTKLAKERIYTHQENIIRSLQKDKKAYIELQKSQRGEIDPKSPAQFIVKNLRAHLETKGEKSTFEDRLYRSIKNSPVAEIDSEDEIVPLESEINQALSETMSKSATSQSSSSSEASSNSVDSEELADKIEETKSINSKILAKKETQSLSQAPTGFNKPGRNKDRRTSDVFEDMLQNRMVAFLNDLKEKKKKQQDEKTRKLKELEKVKTNPGMSNYQLPPSTIDEKHKKLLKNYGTIKEIVDLVKEENVALSQAISELYNHNKFIRDKTIENEEKIKRLLNKI
ncbi:unnamed protein product [Moneuplotes crassus]|uniref:Cyclic nucleotide-binding domain-containing protein n=1 Tax=Euplotes crassus TaxID=5936 RepID=A0AAD1UMP1_EUPCR|nr:unnamed protein product [Moneuplotes crassus]